ncbi:hypothetical protein WPS_03250 [Vulcanimicrobium alpinum]|uniref:Uncharacterized protein n=2 Tax=Vulcanimicrobium alpinum TaxID=3016050 RepID=A0AAN1XTX4_UNVUL|nr:hypothetical protein WPS_03250 [Vulcanimicrobium alpinum]
MLARVAVSVRLFQVNRPSAYARAASPPIETPPNVKAIAAAPASVRSANANRATRARSGADSVVTGGTKR